MFEDFKHVKLFEKQENTLLRITSFISFVFAFILLGFAILHAVFDPWDWMYKTSPTRQTLFTWHLSWIVYQVIYFMIFTLIICLLSQEIHKIRLKKIKTDYDIVELVFFSLSIIITLGLIVCVVGELTTKFIALYCENINVHDMWNSGSQFGFYEFYIFEICSWIIFSSLFVYYQIKYSELKEFNSLYFILGLFFVFLMVSNIIRQADHEYTNTQRLLFGEYFMRALGFLWLGITAFVITRKVKKNEINKQ
ncbi:MAG: hypothetical protein GPJ51_13275 [Candidatus Heimdallarchaeota archaeon]|nr:hypothetical protein [Candidatus Heimdallarchaeota archaeon]